MRAALRAGIAAAASPTPQATTDASSTSIGSSWAENSTLPSGLLKMCENTTTTSRPKASAEPSTNPANPPCSEYAGVIPQAATECA